MTMWSPRLVCVCIIVHVSAQVSAHSTPAAVCQSKVNRHKNLCYWVETTTASFTDSQQNCAAKGGNLATIDSPETSDFLRSFAKDTGVASSIWIGYDIRNQAWADGTPVSWTNYLPGEPNEENADCIALATWAEDFGWVDLHCPRPMSSLCQIQVEPVICRFESVNKGSTVSVGDRVVVVQTDSVLSCGRQCARDPYCYVYRYTRADKTCTMYNSGDIIQNVDNFGEWFLY